MLRHVLLLCQILTHLFVSRETNATITPGIARHETDSTVALSTARLSDSAVSLRECVCASMHRTTAFSDAPLCEPQRRHAAPTELACTATRRRASQAVLRIDAFDTAAQLCDQTATPHAARAAPTQAATASAPCSLQNAPNAATALSAHIDHGQRLHAQAVAVQIPAVSVAELKAQRIQPSRDPDCAPSRAVARAAHCRQCLSRDAAIVAVQRRVAQRIERAPDRPRSSRVARRTTLRCKTRAPRSRAAREWCSTSLRANASVARAFGKPVSASVATAIAVDVLIRQSAPERRRSTTTVCALAPMLPAPLPCAHAAAAQHRPTASAESLRAAETARRRAPTRTSAPARSAARP
jgi:hypothetical protein